MSDVFHILFAVLLWLVLVVVCVVVVFSSFDRFDTKRLFRLTETGRGFIQGGIVAVPITTYVCFVSRFEGAIVNVVGNNAYPYYFCGGMVAIIIIGFFSRNWVPRKLVVPLGLSGWVLSAALVFYWFSYGPGSVKM